MTEEIYTPHIDVEAKAAKRRRERIAEVIAMEPAKRTMAQRRLIWRATAKEMQEIKG